MKWRYRSTLVSFTDIRINKCQLIDDKYKVVLRLIPCLSSCRLLIVIMPKKNEEGHLSSTAESPLSIGLTGHGRSL